MSGNPQKTHKRADKLTYFKKWHTLCNKADRYYKLNKINMSVKLKPLADRVLIEPAPAETTTASGIIIPDTAQEKPQKGKVVAVGAGTKENPITVKVGNIVLYGKYAGTELKLEGKTYLIMRENDLLGILE